MPSDRQLLRRRSERRDRHFRSLLAQFGLTPKSKRGLPLRLRVRWVRRRARLAKNQPAEIAMFQISEVQEAPAFNGRRSFLTLRLPLQPVRFFNDEEIYIHLA
jgi:hypothetical protein